MQQRNRREFLEDSMFAAAAAVAAQPGADLLADQQESRNPAERLGVAIVGARGRGASHIGALAARKDTEILYVCDVDSEVGQRRVQEVAKRQGRKPKWLEDLRYALEDDRVDVVSIATPNHLHAMQTIWSLQAGKDAFVETPASHNLSEGRRMVEAARKYQRICQVGSQCRSNAGMAAAIEHLHSGKLGHVQIARGLCYQRRPAIGPKVSVSPPAHVNYDLWLGPAAVTPVTRRHFHHHWHWQSEYGNGDLGNQGIHPLDVARWGLGVTQLSAQVMSYGGCFHCNDAGDLANTQVVTYEFGDRSIVFEVRGLSSSSYRRAKVGVIFEGTDGYLVMHSYHRGAAFDLDGQKICEFKGGGDHLANFLSAVRSRSVAKLNADIEEGHLSSALGHLGNISYRLGTSVPLEDACRRIEAFQTGDASETLCRTIAHLQQNQVDLQKERLCVGPALRMDSKTETFHDNPKANAMLSRVSRSPFIVPDSRSL